jgi:Zn-dependent protease
MLSSLVRALLSGEAPGMGIIVQFFAIIFIALCCFPIHESAHAWMEDRLGDPTGRLRGRITLNPLAHLDLIGSLMILLFGFGYAKPVPVNINNFPAKKRKLYFALTALAGPVSNLLLAVLFSLLSNMFMAIIVSRGSTTLLSVAMYFFSAAASVNVSLAIFNLIPIPPLDGSRILMVVLPDHVYNKFLQYERYSMYALFALIFIFNRIGISPIGSLSGIVYNGIDWITSLPFAHWIG